MVMALTECRNRRVWRIGPKADAGLDVCPGADPPGFDGCPNALAPNAEGLPKDEEPNADGLLVEAVGCAEEVVGDWDANAPDDDAGLEGDAPLKAPNPLGDPPNAVAGLMNSDDWLFRDCGG